MVMENVILALQVVNRLLEPREVAEMAVFLCADQARGITGTRIAMDLGWTTR